jgi:hypothetical protein
LGAPITQATASGNNVILVYPDRVELRGGWQGQKLETLGIKDVSMVSVQGIVNCTLVIGTNAGRVLRLEKMALPDARRIKNAIEQQKRKAGLYE